MQEKNQKFAKKDRPVQRTSKKSGDLANFHDFK